MNRKRQRTGALENAIRMIRENGGTIRTSDAIQAGIHPRTLYQLRDRGELEQISRGIYRLAEMGPVSNPELVIVASRIPRGVVCLVSALHFHEITTQIPRKLSVAIPQNCKAPVMNYPPVQFHKFSRQSYEAGIEEHEIDGVVAKVYGPDNSLADCFKFRNKIGMDIVLEALNLYRKRMAFDHKQLLKFAAICRVDTVMRPYLEVRL